MPLLLFGMERQCMWGEVRLSDDKSSAFQPKQTVALIRTDTIFRPK
ncbi:hypothetical protein [Bacteroides fragilis]|nr:hypothetical protein [Bacteroides fragilis]